MESIVSKVHTELVDLATTYADAGRENVTLSLMADFQRAVFPLLDERIRIKDLEQSEELRDEMVQLLGDEHPTEPAWPYLDQLDKQDRCFAKMGCKFQLGAGLYRSPSCEEHFVCKNHQSSPCIAKHEQAPDYISQTRPDEKETAASPEDLEKEPRVRADLAKSIFGDDKIDRADAVEKSAGKRDTDDDWLPEPQAEEIPEKEKPTKEAAAKRAADTSALKGMVSFADVLGNFTRADKGSEKPAAPSMATESTAVIEENPKRGDEKAEKLEKLEKKAADEEHRPAKFKVEDAQYLSVDDFSYDRGSLMSEVQVCQLRTKSGALVWVPMEDYLRLKHEYVRLASSDESEWDDGIVKGEDMNRQNADVGK
ncbi:hypothetical protein AA0115_g12486 [Alternaria tenuissima]|uniref:C3H1-type domain-containing protein n=1 Tax=Alternaria tenuissima TaxID=119927 RepID=A0AB37W115_9PLEO|nr:hypothetical protein AA0115_g12486 [Alternaria tenuissima]